MLQTDCLVSTLDTQTPPKDVLPQNHDVNVQIRKSHHNCTAKPTNLIQTFPYYLFCHLLQDPILNYLLVLVMTTDSLQGGSASSVFD